MSDDREVSELRQQVEELEHQVRHLIERLDRLDPEGKEPPSKGGQLWW